MMAPFYHDTISCICIVEAADESEETSQDDVQLISKTSSRCSVNCGTGTKTTMTVICKGKKLKNTENYNIMSSGDCIVQNVTSPCKGTDLKCPG